MYDCATVEERRFSAASASPLIRGFSPVGNPGSVMKSPQPRVPTPQPAVSGVLGRFSRVIPRQPGSDFAEHVLALLP